MKTTLLMIIFSALSSFTVSGQNINATTDDGKRVILNEDGTWKYLNLDNEDIKKSYECDDLILKETDKMTGKSSSSSKKPIIISKDGKNGIAVFFMKTQTSLIFSIHAVGAGSCIDDDDKMNVLFRDGSRLELVNNGKFNCEGDFTLYFGGVFGKKKELELFKTKEIETMRIWTSKGYVEEDLSPEQSIEIIKTIECLAN